jgi:hypothetical protein
LAQSSRQATTQILENISLPTHFATVNKEIWARKIATCFLAIACLTPVKQEREIFIFRIFTDLWMARPLLPTPHSLLAEALAPIFKTV